MSYITFSPNCNTCGKSIILVQDSGGCGCVHPQVPCAHTPNSPCVECDTPCDDMPPSDCWTYGGADIPILGIKNGDLGTEIIIKLAAELIAIKGETATQATLIVQLSERVTTLETP